MSTDHIPEYEQDYLAISQQLVDLLRKKTIIRDTQSSLESLHNRLTELGATALMPDLTTQIQHLLNERPQCEVFSRDLKQLHGQLIELGKKLGWSAREEKTGHLTELQLRVQEIRAQLG